MEAVMSAFAGAEFDAVLTADMLHLLPQPIDWLCAAAKLLSPGGEIVGSVSNTSSWLWPIKDWRNGRLRWIRPSYDANGAQPMSERRLVRCAGRAALVGCGDARWMVPALQRVPGINTRKLAPSSCSARAGVLRNCGLGIRIACTCASRPRLPRAWR